MTLKKRVISIALSLMVAVTFMPMMGQAVFAEGAGSSAASQPAQAFNPGGAVAGLGVVGYNYKSVTIGWAAYDMAAGYQVYSSTKKKGKYRRICTTAGLACYDKKNKRLGKKRYYKVRAFGTVDGRTVFTGFSGVISAKPKIPAPTAWSAGSTSKITVAWNKVAGASRYQVYRATSMYGKYKRLTTTKKRSYTGKSVTQNKKYYYKIRATRGSKKGSFCGPVEGITILPAPSWVGAGSNSSGGINVSWSGVGNAAGYQIFRSTSAGEGFQHVGTAGATSFTDTDANLVNGTTYFYKVRAYASVNGGAQFGNMSSGSYRDTAVAQAVAWIGCKESNGSHKEIVNIYNSVTNMGKIGYKTSWCAAFVSAVAINTGNTSVIPVDCYCPRMLNTFRSWGRTADRNFLPSGGDLIFYDWNNNNVPDHVGMVYYSTGNQVTTIEGNFSDAVKCRTVSRGGGDILSYGLPAYSEQGRVTYNAPVATSASAGVLVEDPVTEVEVQEAVEAVETGETTQQPAGEEPKQPADEESKLEASGVAEIQAAGVPVTESATEELVTDQEASLESDREKVDTLMEYIEEEKPAEESPAEESTYNAFLMFKACEDMGIEACVITEVKAGGEEKSYNEIIIDGERYIVDASVEGSAPIKYTPEELN